MEYHTQGAMFHQFSSAVEYFQPTDPTMVMGLTCFILEIIVTQNTVLILVKKRHFTIKMAMPEWK